MKAKESAADKRIREYNEREERQPEIIRIMRKAIRERDLDVVDCLALGCAITTSLESGLAIPSELRRILKNWEQQLADGMVE